MITDGDAVWTMVQFPSVEDRGTEPLGMLADHDELIDAEARQPLTSRQFDIECSRFHKNVAHAYCVNASAQQSPQPSRSGPHPTR